jgi:hypothetical protein
VKAYLCHFNERNRRKSGKSSLSRHSGGGPRVGERMKSGKGGAESRCTFVPSDYSNLYKYVGLTFIPAEPPPSTNVRWVGDGLDAPL